MAKNKDILFIIPIDFFAVKVYYLLNLIFREKIKRFIRTDFLIKNMTNMNTEKNKNMGVKNTFIDRIFKASFFVFGLSLVFSLLISNVDKIAYADDTQGATNCVVSNFYANPNPIITTSANSPHVQTGVTNITADADCMFDIRVGSPSGNLLSQGGPGLLSVDTGNWVTDGMSFYLQKRDSISSSGTLSSFVVNLVTPVEDISVTLSANPTFLEFGDSTTLNWVTSGSPDSCVASGSWSGTKNVNGGSENILNVPVGDHSYTITCSKAGVSDVSSSVTVTRPESWSPKYSNSQVINSIQGYNTTTNIYSNVVRINDYAILYGDFEESLYVNYVYAANPHCVGPACEFTRIKVDFDYKDSNQINVPPSNFYKGQCNSYTIEVSDQPAGTSKIWPSNQKTFTVYPLTGDPSVACIPGGNLPIEPALKVNLTAWDKNPGSLYSKDLKVSNGSPVDLIWNLSGSPEYCVASGSWSGNKNVSNSTNSETVTGPNNSVQIYTISCFRNGGTEKDTSSVKVTWGDPNFINTPPTITLIGSNPATTTVGTTFTDPGATANDLEDGNITNKIVVTGTVDSNTVGEYTLTYTVTDTGGLSASTTRKVVVTTAPVNPPQCLLPEITSSLTAEVQVNSSFSYTLTASSTATTTLNVATTTLPAGLTYSNGVISGTPTVVGTYNITLEASNACGTTTKTLVLTVKDVPPPICIGCGGGSGGGGGNGPIIQSLTIFNEYVQEIEPGVAMVTWNTNLPATREVVYGNNSQTVLGLAPLYGYTNNTEKILTPLSTTHSMVVPIDPNKVYYFRPVSSDSSRTVLGKELNITRGQSPVEQSCFYLYDFLRKDFNNNPVEVRKLQVFLRDLEGFNSVQITGVYDDQTIVALNAFQDRYAGDILTPWGHTAPTGYTYILTKKKVNEIYCQRAFPVTQLEQQEIDSFRAFLESLRGVGIDIENNIPVAPINPNQVEIQNEIIGSIGDTEEVDVDIETGTSTMTTLAGVTGTTRNIITNLTANVLQSGKNLLNYVLGIFNFPTIGVVGDDSVEKPWYLNWVVILGIIAIMASLYLWYRENKKNKEEEEEIKKIEDLNKEIDLK